VVSVEIGDDLKAPVQRDNLALDVLLQNPAFQKSCVNCNRMKRVSGFLPNQPHADLALENF
jgi:hypothetical protein